MKTHPRSPRPKSATTVVSLVTALLALVAGTSYGQVVRPTESSDISAAKQPSLRATVAVDNLAQRRPQATVLTAPITDTTAAARPPAALAQPSRNVEPGISSDTVRTMSRTIGDFLGIGGQIQLHGPDVLYPVSIPVSPRMQVIDATTEIKFTNSISLNSDLSHIALMWNEEVLAQAPLMSENPRGQIAETLPGVPFSGGYHELALKIAQHYARQGECEDPSSSVLWSKVDAEKSVITFDYRLRELGQINLSELPNLIDPKLWGDYELSIVTEQAHATEDHHLRWGALMAQRAATLLDYKPLVVAHHDALVAGYDQVVIGTRSELAQVIPEAYLNRITDSYVGIFKHPYDGGHFLMVISGDSPTSVDRAVQAVALTNDSLPAAPEMAIDRLDLPVMEKFTVDRALNQGESVALSELGFESYTVSGMGAPRFNIDFVLPPDLYADESANVTLNLHFAHGAALRADSVLNVEVNEKFAYAIYLKEKEGASYRDYKVEIPLRSFNSGKNTLSFVPVMMPSVSGHCEIVNTQNLLFTLFDDTEIRMPSASHYVRLPDLHLWQRTAFPAMVDPLGENFAIHIVGKDSDTLSSAFMIAGKLAQINGTPMVNMSVGRLMPRDDQHWITVGEWDGLNSEMIANAPVQLGPDGRVPSMIARVPSNRDSSVKESVRREAAIHHSVLHGTTRSGDKGILMQFQSNLSAAHAGMILTAEDRETLRLRTAELIQPGIWERQKGDTFVWSGTGDNEQKAERLGGSFYLGKAGLRTKAVYHFSHRPWMNIVIAIIGVLILAGLVKNALAKFHGKNHVGAEA